MSCDTTEQSLTERPLSPILNSTRIQRRVMCGIRRKLTKIPENQKPSKITQIRSEILTCRDPTQRLQKIKQYEDEKQRLIEYFYRPKAEHISDFDFKRPAPVKHHHTEKVSSSLCEGEKAPIFESSLEREAFELEQVLNRGDSVLHEKVVFDHRTHIINTIKSENHHLIVVNSLEKVFLGFEDLEIRLATKLFNKITDAHKKKCKSMSSELSDSNSFSVGEAIVMMDEQTKGVSCCDEVPSNASLNEIDFSQTFSTQTVSNNQEEEVLSTSTDLITNANAPRFSTAAGKTIKISSEALSNAAKMFSDDDYHKQLKLNSDSKSVLVAAVRKNIQGSDASLYKVNQLPSGDFDDLLPATNAKHGVTDRKILNDPSVLASNQLLPGFTTAAGTKIEVSNEAIQKANKLLDVDVDCPAVTLDCTSGFSTAAGKNINISEQALFKARKSFSNELDNPPQSLELHKASDKNKSMGSLTEHPPKAESLSVDYEPKVIVPTDYKNGGFSTAAGSKIKISDEALRKANNLFNEETAASTAFKSNCVGNVASATTVPFGFTNAHGKNIQISEKALKKAQAMFDSEVETTKLDTNRKSTKTNVSDVEMDITTEAETLIEQKTIPLDTTDSKATLRRGKKRLGISGCKQIPIAYDKIQKAQSVFDDCEVVEPYTPTKCNQTDMYNSTPIKLQPISKSWAELNSLSPVAKKPRICNDSGLDVKSSVVGITPIILQQYTNDRTKLLDDFTACCKDLENKLLIMQKRRNALQQQIQLIESADEAHKRQRPGILLLKKQSKQKKSLQTFLLSPSSSTHHLLKKITPQNALHIHFKDNSFEDVVSVRTEDGAYVIPNTNHIIGLAEIKSAFSVMPGIDPKLIPGKWIDNHYKWIMWKLASYERNFGDLSGCLTVENVIQQLKYRYDREIDMAQRSALRRILEKDDVSQKRMVLCVSNIYKVSDAYELELCDGWYSVRTIIDPALSFQVKCGKIVIGTKLITQYAELLDCDGCHPLEVSDLVRLKINYNCTRRASWYAKLGYQRVPEPFSIGLANVKPEGGLIGCITVYIARVYPLRYMEKQRDGKIIWRNQKAEEKYAQKCENEQLKEVELIRNKINKDYEILTKDDDSQGLQNTQAMNIRAAQQHELSLRLSSEMDKLKKSRRDVAPVLKFRVVDCTHTDERGFVFNIWNAREEHQSDLKEGAVVSIYNVMPRRNGEFTATSRTYFKKHPLMSPKNKMLRQLLPISMLQESFLNPIFNEFDTVGTVVCIEKGSKYQLLWLCDFMKRILLIRVRESSETCSIFDSIRREQHVAVLNLIYCKPHKTLAQAIATQSSIVTSYPSPAFLQEGLAKFCQQLPEDLSQFLKECDDKVDMIKCSINPLLESSNTSNLFNDSVEDSMEIPSRLTSLDIAMSLIDTDQYI